jgi:ATP/maltotriose-dependent transcriptional regulator MalT
MRRTDPENANLPHMLQTLGERIVKAERESRDPSRLAEAEALILEAKAIFTRRGGESEEATVATDNSLVKLALVRGDLARAESLSKDVLRRFQQTDPGSYDHISALIYVGEVKLRQGKEAEAETFFRQALGLARQHWSANDVRIERLVNYIDQARAAAR